MAPSPSKCSRPDTGSAALPLPFDASYEILLRLPAKDLCRLRAVSRAWRSLLSDPQFIAAHRACHPGPLIVSGHPTSTGHRSGDVQFNIMDLSGRIIKRLHVAGDGTTDNATDDVKISSQAGLVCILGDMGKRCRVLDPATGAVTSLPEGLAEEHAANRPDMGQYSATVVCGKVASTGEYKVLRVLDIRLFSFPCFNSNPKPLCELLTLNGSGNARWRGKKTSPDPVIVYDQTSRAVLDGCVYFFLKEDAPLHTTGPKRIASFDPGTEEWRRTMKGPQIVRFVGTTKRCQLLNLATGDVVFSLPEALSEEHAPRKMEFSNYRASVAFGQVASTGEYKLLRVIDNSFFINPYEQLCEVFTVGGGNDARWRGKNASPNDVDMHPLSRVAVAGAVYFFLDEDIDVAGQDARPKRVACFDLLTEEWRLILQGPVPIAVEEDQADYANLSLTALSGFLVLVHRILNAKMDLWFLMDFEKSLWVKQHTVNVNLSVQRDEFLARPLVILNDGNVVTYIESRGLLRIYNPSTNTYTDVAEMGSRLGTCLYSGNLLSLANCATL
ncbi:unnamed protein product [Urochloa decumbens]|uniref:F-box domain-containing protein n=1 Tax=Urochloa decumbens TaxID=240449 RepID=A0ABC9FQW6_9POAL